MALSLLPFLGKISIGYLTISESLTFDEKTSEIASLLKNDPLCLTAMVVFTIAASILFWRYSFRIFSKKVTACKRTSHNKLSKIEIANLAFNGFVTGALLASILLSCVCFPEKESVRSVIFCLLATSISLYHISFLTRFSVAKAKLARERPEATPAETAIPTLSTDVGIFILFISAGALSPIFLYALSGEAGISIIRSICPLLFFYEAIWLTAYGLLYHFRLQDFDYANRNLKPEEEQDSGPLKPFKEWATIDLMLCLLIFFIVFVPCLAVFTCFTKALVGTIALMYQALAALGV